MSSPKPQQVKTPYEGQQQQQQQTTNTYGFMPLADRPEARALMDTNLDFGGGNYSGKAPDSYTGDAYKDIKTKFSVDPGVARRTALAEDSARHSWDNVFMGGIPAEYRKLMRDSDVRKIQTEGAAQQQQAEYMQQQAEAGASVQRAQMRDASELAKTRMTDDAERTRAGMMDSAAAARTAAELERRRLLLPSIVQTGGTSTGSNSSSGYGTQVVQPQGGFWSSFGQGLGGSLGQSII